ncbi:WAT1-related protein At5g40230-like [Malania oleifera]|uniref:WAT1-related protein At5g40230-like n=1 Tax=Malania oleifera TaxID=397392 RepID=UPI0025AEA2EF|nr:WAT1-related protein At5g40230-like [Malania oleifera]
MAEGYCCREVVPFGAMVLVECLYVGSRILFKAASLKGLSNFVFIFYSYAIATLALLPFAILFLRRTALPPLNSCLPYRIFLLGLLGFSAQLLGYKGIEYSSPTLASAMSNLTPAFTFILAICFRMEKSSLRSSSIRLKIIGTTVSIVGALVVILYKGPAIISTSSASHILFHPLGSAQSKWVIGGILLAAEFFLVSTWYIVQVKVMEEYPVEIVVVFFYNLCGSVISAPVCFLAKTNISAWRLRPNIALVAVLYNGLTVLSFGSVIHTWGLRLKGPLYVAIFKPFSIAIAAAMSVVFLGDCLYLGSVVGSIIICIGFYAVIWGKAKEEMGGCGNGSFESSSTPKTPLLQSTNVQDV